MFSQPVIRLLFKEDSIPVSNIILCIYCICTGRNQAYQTRVELAVLDHNAHINRDFAKNKKGDFVYHRKYRKQSKKWDVTPTLTTKKFLYILNLLHEIELERESHMVIVSKPMLCYHQITQHEYNVP